MSRLIKDKQDLTYLKWTKDRNSSGTAGTFLKAFSNIKNKKVYCELPLS